MSGSNSRSMSSGMKDRLNLSRRVTPPPLTDFDNSDAVPAANAQAMMQIQSAGLQKDVILISLLKGWCEANGKSANKSERLYKKMFRKLQDHKFISPANIEALKQCNYDLLKTLVSWSLSSSSEDSHDGRALVPFSRYMYMPPPDQDHSSFFQQRYKKDFIEKETIGEGGFGKVYKVQHKLDHEHYAVKKIKITKKKSRRFQSMQREIETLARLNHPNVVRYHQSWFGEEFHAVTQQTKKSLLMLENRLFGDSKGEDTCSSEDDEDEEVEEGGEDENAEDIIFSESKSGFSSNGLTKPLPTSPIITDVTETKIESRSEEAPVSVTASAHDRLTDPVNPNVFVPFDDERFDSLKIVEDFFTQTTKDMQSINPSTNNKTKEEFSNILFNERTEEAEFDKKTITDVKYDSFESSGTSNTTVVFQNPESDGTDSDDFHSPSLKEQSKRIKQKTSRVEIVRESCQTEQHIETSSQSGSYEQINLTAKTQSRKISFLSPITSSLTTSTHVRSKSNYAPSRTHKHQHRDANFLRSTSWDGKKSSPELHTGYWSRTRPSFKRRYLYIQMELCSSTLRAWLTERNSAIKPTTNQFDVVNVKHNQNIYKQTLEGINYIHASGILHRDVTPKNIFLCWEDDDHLLVKIGDFGLAREDVLTEPKTPMRFQQDHDSDDCDVDPCASQSYTSNVGTTTYAAPEQLDGTTYDNKSDMYSMGLILFELFHPFNTGMERYKCLDNLRKGSIPEEISMRWPAQYSAIKHLTRQDSRERPSASDLLTGDLFPSTDKIIESQANEIERLKRLLEVREAEIHQLKEGKNSQT